MIQRRSFQRWCIGAFTVTIRGSSRALCRMGMSALRCRRTIAFTRSLGTVRGTIGICPSFLRLKALFAPTLGACLRASVTLERDMRSTRRTQEVASARRSAGAQMKRLRPPSSRRSPQPKPRLTSEKSRTSKQSTRADVRSDRSIVRPTLSANSERLAKDQRARMQMLI